MTAWTDIPESERAFQTRLMELYAGFVEHTDAQVGKLVDFLDETGQRDNTIIFYVWETGGFAPQRTWLVNDDGSANRPFYYTTDPKQWITPLKEWATHEAWIRETGDMTIIIDKVGIVIADPSGKGRLLPGDYWHVAARPDGKKLVADSSKGNLWLIDAATDSRRLLATGLRDSVRAVHAHASFDRTGRYVLFNSGRTRQTIALIDLSTLAP